jgi:hypothetical protein
LLQELEDVLDRGQEHAPASTAAAAHDAIGDEKGGVAMYSSVNGASEWEPRGPRFGWSGWVVVVANVRHGARLCDLEFVSESKFMCSDKLMPPPGCQPHQLSQLRSVVNVAR